MKRAVNISALILLLGALALTGGARPAAAITVTVDTFVDSADPAFQACTGAANDCSLRGAIIAANALAGADTIRLPAGLYALTIAGFDDAALSGDLDITSDLTLIGLGAGATIDPSALSNERSLHVLAGAAVVSLRKLTLTGGKGIDGAGMRIETGAVTVRDMTIDGNDAMSNFAGGIYNAGTLIVRTSEITNNNSDNGNGGGIYNEAGATLLVVSSTISGNTAVVYGGGIYNAGATTISRSTVSNNTAENGGGVASFPASTVLTVADSTIDGNVATAAIGYPQGGGGIWSHSVDASDQVTITRSTISDNTAAGAWGGGVMVFTGRLTLNNTTVTRNSALFGGGVAAGGDTVIGRGRITRNDAADDGGGLWMAGGVTTIPKSLAIFGEPAPVIANNTANGNGGGAYVSADNNMTFATITATIRDNAALGFGGGVYYLDARPDLPNTLAITNSLVQRNEAAAGGGLYLYGATAQILTTTVRNNVAGSEGGGIRLTDSTTVITASTVSGNDVTAGDGGGLYNEDDLLFSQLAVNNSTISGNTASDRGGGIYNEVSGAFGSATYLFNVTVAENSAGLGGSGVAANAGLIEARNSIIGEQAVTGDDCATGFGGVITGIGTNLEEGVSCGFTINAVAPLLDPLALNAPGLTETHALQAGSPAINAGPVNCVGDSNGDGVPDLLLATDQRGSARNGNCDLGSYEF